MAIQLSQADQQTRIASQKQAQTDAAAATQLKANVDAQVVVQQKADALNKSYFDYYNGIVLSYETELRRIDGAFITNPVTETDIQNAGQLSGRLSPTSPTVLDPIRVPELDGGGIDASTDSSCEEAWVTQENAIPPFLQTGFSGTALSVTTSSAITSSSTTFTVASASSGIANGNRLVISGSSHSCIVDVSNVAVAGSVTTVTFTFVSVVTGVSYTPSGTIATGAAVSRTLTAFTNTERTNKTATNANFQDILNKSILGWQTALTGHSSMVSQQKTAVDGNQDDNLDKTVSPALATFISAITSYLVTTDVSNSGLASINATLASRLTAKNARKAAIPTAKSAYYDRRYNFVLLRVNIAKGSLVLYNSYSHGSGALASSISYSSLAAGAFET